MSSNNSKEPIYLKQELKEEDVAKLLKIIETVQKDNMAFDFLEPVDWEGLGLLDYPKIISHPMDIGTLKKNLEEGQFKTFQDFLSDLNLIWKNCRTYNLPGSEIVKMANHCDKKFKQLIDKAFKNYQVSNKGSSASNKKNNNNDSSTNNNGLTLSEKTKLIEAIREQSNEGLTQVVKIILKECPKGIEDIDNEKLQIKIDLLDHKTYDLINNYFDKAGNNAAAGGSGPSGGNNNNSSNAEKNKTPKK